jgi:hypothetical protein
MLPDLFYFETLAKTGGQGFANIMTVATGIGAALRAQDVEIQAAALRLMAELHHSRFLRTENPDPFIVNKWIELLIPLLQIERTKWLAIWALAEMLENFRSSWRFDCEERLLLLPFTEIEQLINVSMDEGKSRRAKEHAKTILETLIDYGAWKKLAPQNNENVRVCALLMWWQFTFTDKRRVLVSDKLQDMLELNTKAEAQVFQFLIGEMRSGRASNVTLMWIIKFFLQVIERSFARGRCTTANVVFDCDRSLEWLLCAAQQFPEPAKLLRRLATPCPRAVAVAVKFGFVDFM